MRPGFVFIFLIVFSIAGCKKEGFITSGDARIGFSADTLNYDTVFTSVGSITKILRIHNDNDQKLRLSNVELAGGANSPFKINVDGLPGNATGVEIEGRDSLYVFVSVTVNPGAANAPFILEDSLRVRFNGNERFVQLRAWGQNANFLRKYVVTGNETWTSDKPYVILDGVTIAKNATLNIQKGSRIYFHANSPMVVDGSLQVKGERYDSMRVRFLGDRLDAPYSDYPGAWPGIYFRADSHDNIMEFALVGNAFQGIVVDQPAAVGTNPKLILNETIIRNCFDAGLIGVRGTIRSRNTLIANCGKNMVIHFGGTYDFVHLTSVAYSNSFITHKDPLLSITNVIEANGSVLAADLTANFRNSIFWADGGITKEEIVVKKEGNYPFAVNFSNSDWKLSSAPANTTATAMLNQDPMFIQVDNDRKLYNFRLKDNSPLIGKGVAGGLATDLDGLPRKTTNPDPGAYEKQ